MRRVHPSDLLILGAAFAVRVWALGASSLWLDEALMVGRAQMDWWTAARGRTPLDLAPPLYPLLLHVWSLLGSHDFWIRFPSVMFGTLAVAVLLRLRDRSVGRLAAALLAVAPVQIHYAQEATPYALVGLLSAATLVAADAAGRGRKRGWSMLAGLALLNAYTYYGLGFLAAPIDLQALGAWWRRRRAELGLNRMAAGHTLVALTIVPLVPWAMRQSGAAMVAWLGHYGRLDGWAGLTLFAQGVLAHGLLFSLFPFSQAPITLLAAFAVAAALGAVRRPRWAIFGWLIPLALAYSASAWGLYAFEGRYLLFAAPVLYALIAGGVMAVRPRALRWLTVAAALGLFASGWPDSGLNVAWRARPPHEETRAVIEAVVRRHADESIYVTYGAGPALQHYQVVGLAPSDAVIQADWPAGRVGYQAERALAAAADHNGLWIITAHAEPGEEEALAEALVHRGATLLDRIVAPGATAMLFQLAPPRSASR